MVGLAKARPTLHFYGRNSPNWLPTTYRHRAAKMDCRGVFDHLGRRNYNCKCARLSAEYLCFESEGGFTRMTIVAE